jgi:hypothetical protein
MSHLIEGKLGILAIDMHRGHLDPRGADAREKEEET